MAVPIKSPNATLMEVLSPYHVEPMKFGWLADRRTVTRTTARMPSIMGIGFAKMTVGLVANAHREASPAMEMIAYRQANALL